MDGFKLAEFIAQLRASAVLAPYDLAFLISFDEQFAFLSTPESTSPVPSAPDEHLTPETGSALPVASVIPPPLNPRQLEWLQKALATRWDAIADTPNEYTVNQECANKHWIELAKRLASSTGKTYFQLLMPTITNITDPNSFAKHTDSDELCKFYVGEGRRTIFSIPILLNRCIRSSSFVTYRNTTDPRKYVVTPLSLIELAKIRAKGSTYANDSDRERGITSAAFVCSVTSEPIKDPWTYILRKFVPTWSKSGVLPDHLGSLLFELVALYFTERHSATGAYQFSQKLHLLAKSIQDCAVKDANCLYGQVIHVGDKPVYLLEILLDCLKDEHHGLDSKMRGIARWLCAQNATFVVKSPELADLYTELHLGPAFSISDLQGYLAEMKVGSVPYTQLLITSLCAKLRDKTVIDAEVIAALGEIYKNRWLQIQGKADDYTRLQGGNNKVWIRLAQILRTSNYIKPNYYSFLMPTLTHDIDPVSKGCLTENPLSHYILAQDGKNLIYLGNCKANYEADGTFNKCISEKATLPLTDIERERVSYADVRYRKYIKLIRYKDIGAEDPPIRKSTLMAVFNLVNDSISPRGLLWRNTPLAEGAESAYDTFCVFLNDLPEDERERLLNQEIGIYYENKLVKIKSVKALLEDSQKDQCIDGIGRSLAQLVMDYAPHLKFKPEIEEVANMDAMRELCSKKVLSDYKCDEHEAKRRLQILVTSLMTHSFKYYPLGGYTESIGDCKNTMVGVAKKIYDLLMSEIASGDFKHPGFLYAQILETIVFPALDPLNKSFWSRADTQAWLQSIADTSMFTTKKNWVPRQLLLEFFIPFPFIESPATRLLFQTFFEELLQIYVQPATPKKAATALEEIRLNIKFKQLLNTLPELAREEVLRKVFSKSVDSPSSPDLNINALIQYLVNVGGVIPGISSVVKTAGYEFASVTEYDVMTQWRMREIKTGLERALSLARNKSSNGILEALILGLNSLSPDVCDVIAKTRMTLSLERICGTGLLPASFLGPGIIPPPKISPSLGSPSGPLSTSPAGTALDSRRAAAAVEGGPLSVIPMSASPSVFTSGVVGSGAGTPMREFSLGPRREGFFEGHTRVAELTPKATLIAPASPIISTGGSDPRHLSPGVRL